MAFREASGGPELSQLEGFPSGPKFPDQKADLPHIDLGGAAEAADLEEPTILAEQASASSASAGEDPVRLYLKEIGKVSLLKAEEEVAIGQRIEAGQIALRRALGGIPMAVSKLLSLV